MCDTTLSKEYFKLRSKKTKMNSNSKKNQLNSSHERKNEFKNENEEKVLCQTDKPLFQNDLDFLISNKGSLPQITNSDDCSSSLDHNKITLKDLCPDDKAKIGELIKKLAAEKKEKEELLSLMEERQREFEQSIGAITQESKNMAMESLELKEKFRYSLNLIRKMQVVLAVLIIISFISGR